MKKIVILGMSGSVGQQTHQVILRHPDQFQLVGFSVWHRHHDIPTWINQHPHVTMIAVQSDQIASEYQLLYPHIRFVSGAEGLIQLAEWSHSELVVSAIVGFAGLAPTLAAIRSHHDIALANKETLVVAGELITDLLKSHPVHLFPVDSEHSALTQALVGESLASVDHLILTASGGPFRSLTRAQLSGITPEQALRHPTWTMGAKISIDSATMVNKGLEIIEAHFLFHIPYDRIDVVIHPQSVVHSAVSFIDGSVKAQLGATSMEIPILYALAGHQHCADTTHPFNFFKHPQLTFEVADSERFPALRLAYQVGREGGTKPCIFNAANEIAVEAFLHHHLPFHLIETVIEETCKACPRENQTSLSVLLTADQQARQIAQHWVHHLGGRPS